MKSYFLDKLGAKTSRAKGRPGEGHEVIGREVLAKLGVTPKDEQDIYEQMFRLKYVRVVEPDERTLEVEFLGQLTTAQFCFVQDMERRGWKVKRLKYEPRSQPPA